MKTYSVRHRVSGSGLRSIEGERKSTEAVDSLDSYFAKGDIDALLSHDPNYLKFVMNSSENPQCIAMTFEEATHINRSLDNGVVDADFESYLNKLDSKNLVTLQPYGSSSDRTRRNTKYIIDLAKSGEDFPKIKRDAHVIDVAFFGKASGEDNWVDLYISPIDFPTDLNNKKDCDLYLYVNLNHASKHLLESGRFSDKENMSRLLERYKEDPKATLNWIRNSVCEDDKDPSTLIFNCSYSQQLVNNVYGKLWADNFLK